MRIPGCHSRAGASSFPSGWSRAPRCSRSLSTWRWSGRSRGRSSPGAASRRRGWTGTSRCAPVTDSWGRSLPASVRGRAARASRCWPDGPARWDPWPFSRTSPVLPACRRRGRPSEIGLRDAARPLPAEDEGLLALVKDVLAAERDGALGVDGDTQAVLACRRLQLAR